MLSFPFLHYFAKKMSEKKKSVACVANMFSFQFSGLTHTLLPRTFYSSIGFPTGWDSTTFWDNGTEVSSLSRDKGTTGQAQNLAKGRDGPGQLKSGTGRAGTAQIRDGTREQ